MAIFSKTKRPAWVFWFLFSGFWSTDLSGQQFIRIRPDLPEIVEAKRQLFNEQGQEFLKMFDKAPYPNGFGLCTDCFDDTLNIHALDTAGYGQPVSFFGKNKAIFGGAVVLHGDTANIYIGEIMADQSIRHKIDGDSIWTYYVEDYRIPRMVKSISSDTFSQKMELEIEVDSIVLSCKEPKSGEYLWGYVSFTTPDFYVKTSYMFKNQIIFIRRHFRYYFKLPVLEL